VPVGLDSDEGCGAATHVGNSRRRSRMNGLGGPGTRGEDRVSFAAGRVRTANLAFIMKLFMVGSGSHRK